MPISCLRTTASRQLTSSSGDNGTRELNSIAPGAALDPSRYNALSALFEQVPHKTFDSYYMDTDEVRVTSGPLKAQDPLLLSALISILLTWAYPGARQFAEVQKLILRYAQALGEVVLPRIRQELRLLQNSKMQHEEVDENLQPHDDAVCNDFASADEIVSRNHNSGVLQRSLEL